jgi:hypothetical protein
MTADTTLFNLGTIVAVLVLVAAFAVIRLVRGPLPPAPQPSEQDPPAAKE